MIRPGLVVCDDPSVEYITALSASGRLFIILLNDRSKARATSVAIHVEKLRQGLQIKAARTLPDQQAVTATPAIDVSLPTYGLAAYVLDLQ